MSATKKIVRIVIIGVSLYGWSKLTEKAIKAKKPIIHEFSVLESIDNNKESPDKITPNVFDTFPSIWSFKKWMIAGAIGQFADRKRLTKPGFYTIKIIFEGSHVRTELHEKTFVG